MNQRLVTKKNRKVRQIRELYPDVRIKIFYQRDYLHLIVKYGLADEVKTDDEIADDEAVAAPTRPPGPPKVTRLTGSAAAG